MVVRAELWYENAEEFSKCDSDGGNGAGLDDKK
jgi:hypothetical protein